MAVKPGCKNARMQSNAPVLYLPHGGGPLPLLGDPGHHALVSCLRDLGKNIPRPEAVLVVSAHWEESSATVLGSPRPPLLFDYDGFPAESYDYRYPAPGAPDIAAQTVQLLAAAGVECRSNNSRGLDHGAFVPLMLMYPEANLPCTQLSLLNTLDPAAHIALGEALQTLRQQGVMILGSGSPFHNMRALVDGEAGRRACREFMQWLKAACCDVAPDETAQKLIDWRRAPSAAYAHPREEHLLPLHVCLGASLAADKAAECVFDDEVMGYQMCGFLWR